MEKFFKLKENGTTVGREIVAGLTTFFAMAYIIVVNPNTLSGRAGGLEEELMPWGAVFLATIIASIIGTLVMGLVAKEEVVGVFGVLYGVTDEEGEDAAMGILEDEDMSDAEKSEALSPIAQSFEDSSGGHGQLAAFAFLIFNLLCAPCFAAMGAIKREMNNGKWTAFAIAYQCVFAYVVALIVYQLGLLFTGGGFGAGTAVAIVLLAFIIYMLVRKNRYDESHFTQKVKVGA